MLFRSESIIQPLLGEQRTENVRNEKWLVVGDGDLSYSTSLARSLQQQQQQQVLHNNNNKI